MGEGGASLRQAGLMAAAEAPPPDRARELRDLDALGAFASELRELLCGSEASGSMGSKALEKAFAPKHPDAQCARGLRRRGLDWSSARPARQAEA